MRLDKGSATELTEAVWRIKKKKREIGEARRPVAWGMGSRGNEHWIGHDRRLKGNHKGCKTAQKRKDCFSFMCHATTTWRKQLRGGTQWGSRIACL